MSLSLLPSDRFRLDGGAMFGVVPKALWEKTHPCDAANRITQTTRTLLFSDGQRHMLVDPGIGMAWDTAFLERYAIEAAAVSLEASLLECGLRPADITDVLLTHLHFDHIGGCFVFADGRMAMRFANARHHVQAKHWSWAHAPSMKDRASFNSEHLCLLEKSGRLELHDGCWSPATGVEFFPVEGHTHALQLCRIEIDGKTWVYGGDLFALAAHIKVPWVMAYDMEPLKTIEAKLDCLKKHLSKGEILLLGHDDRLVGGRVDQSRRQPMLVDPIEPVSGVQTLYP